MGTVNTAKLLETGSTLTIFVVSTTLTDGIEAVVPDAKLNTIGNWMPAALTLDSALIEAEMIPVLPETDCCLAKLRHIVSVGPGTSLGFEGVYTNV
jgi:hypothetical protein